MKNVLFAQLVNFKVTLVVLHHFGKSILQQFSAILGEQQFYEKRLFAACCPQVRVSISCFRRNTRVVAGLGPACRAGTIRGPRACPCLRVDGSG